MTSLSRLPPRPFGAKVTWGLRLRVRFSPACPAATRSQTSVGPHACPCVPVPPTIADDQTDFTVTKMAPVVLTCHSMGVPAPLVSWRKAGAQLGARGNGYRVLPSGRNGDHGELPLGGPRELGRGCESSPLGPRGRVRRRSWSGSASPLLCDPGEAPRLPSIALERCHFFS